MKTLFILRGKVKKGKSRGNSLASQRPTLISAENPEGIYASIVKLIIKILCSPLSLALPKLLMKGSIKRKVIFWTLIRAYMESGLP